MIGSVVCEIGLRQTLNIVIKRSNYSLDQFPTFINPLH